MLANGTAVVSYADGVPSQTGGGLLSLIASGRAKSRAELIEISGLSRATVAQRLSALLETGLVEEASQTLRSGGRPARMLRVNPNFAVVLAADIGERHVRVAATDLDGRILQSAGTSMDVRDGPKPVLSWIVKAFEELLASEKRDRREILGVGLSLPAPVDYALARVVGPSVMLGWDNFDLRRWLGEKVDAPVFADNDVNLLMLEDWRRNKRNVPHLVYIKIGTGIGSGIIADGRIYRGAQGASGDIGHIQFAREPAPLCRCGKVGCLEARAAGWAIARDLRSANIAAENARDVVELVKKGEPRAIHLVRESGRVLGEVISNVVSVLNPNEIVVGGTLASVDEYILSGVRELIHSRNLPLATRELTISVSTPNSDAGLIGAALLVVGEQMSGTSVDDVIARHLEVAS